MKKKIIVSVSILFAVALTVFIILAMQNPRVRLLLSVVHFTEETLKDPSYLLYDVDIMEFIHDYLNADTSVSGEAQLYNIQGLGFSVSADITGIRSLPKSQSSMTGGIAVIGKKVGNIELYAEDETVYFVVPMLRDMAYAFPTGIDLFMRMPDLTSDLDKEWFRANAANILKFTKEIGLEETGATIKSPNGRLAREYVITIPEGSGIFIWDLLGMDYPEYDVVVSLYLTDRNRFRRMEIDLSDVLPGALLVVDGENAHSGTLYYGLPDDERVEFTMTRDGEHKNKITMDAVYYTNTDQKYTVTGDLYWSTLSEGTDLKCKDVTVKKGNKTLATAYFAGTLLPLAKEPAVFADATVDLYSLKKLDWKAIRDDVDGFMNDMKEVLAEYQNN